MLQYLIKFSISLAVMYTFYRAVLRPLTFYQCNRFYLLGYALLSFAIPLIDVSPWLSGRNNHALVSIIPVIGGYGIEPGHAAVAEHAWWQSFTIASVVLAVVCAGAAVMLARILLQYRSLHKIRQQAVLLETNGAIRLYETTEPVSPFSFGSAIYFNRMLHSRDELQRIIQHEFVHVQQQHSIDLIVAELLCIVNWFNPFAWLIRHSIRQNLEFIADNKVVENGLDKKEYQYLLLKVVGIPQYSIAGNFNFSNLKKRIAMMNKIKTPKLHLTRFLFVVPLIAIVFLAFRKASYAPVEPGTAPVNRAIADTVTPMSSGAASRVSEYPPANKQGYIITVADNNGECVVLVKDKSRRIVKAITLVEWNNKKKENERQYGEIAPPPPAPTAPVFSGVPAAPLQVTAPSEPAALKDEQVPAQPVPVSEQVKPLMNVTEQLHALNQQKKPLVIVDGKEMPADFDLNRLEPNIIKDISVAKDAYAMSKFGEKGKNGVIDITTKNYSKPQLPYDILIVLNGRELPTGSKIEDFVKPDAIESMNVLKDKTATDKYGAKAKNGVIEVRTKNALPFIPGVTDTLFYKRDSTIGKTRFKTMTAVKDQNGLRTRENYRAAKNSDFARTLFDTKHIIFYPLSYPE
ncbi:MAG: M56 family metallopeptidase [Chitinophagaceae bacterium]